MNGLIGGIRIGCDIELISGEDARKSVYLTVLFMFLEKLMCI